jgi:hypothetical protein
MTLDEELLRQARDASTRWAAAEDRAGLAKAEYHHAVRRLHTAGGSLREIAEALALSHQRVHQITTGKTSGASCSFCGKGSDHVAKLVAGQSALICDGCVQGAAADHEGTCAFCGQTTTVFGETASICDGCVALAREVSGAASPR